MKTLIFLLFFLQAILAHTQECNNSKAWAYLHTFNDIWTNSQPKKDCSFEALPTACQQKFKNNALIKNEAWKNVSASCEVHQNNPNTALEIIKGCLSPIKNLGAFIGESLAINQLTSQKLIECNKSNTKKFELIKKNNLNLPPMLKYAVPKNLQSTTCQQLQGNMNRFFVTNKQKWLAKTPHYVSETEMTADEKLFQSWMKNQYVKNVLNEMSPNAYEELKLYINSLSCFNTYYKSQMACLVVAQLTTGALKDAIISQAKNTLKKNNWMIADASDAVKSISTKNKPTKIKTSLNQTERAALLKKMDTLEAEMNLSLGSKFDQYVFEIGENNKLHYGKPLSLDEKTGKVVLAVEVSTPTGAKTIMREFHIDDLVPLMDIQPY